MKATATNFEKVLNALWGFQKKRALGWNLIASNRYYFYWMDLLLWSGQQGKDLHFQAPKMTLKKWSKYSKLWTSACAWHRNMHLSQMDVYLEQQKIICFSAHLEQYKLPVSVTFFFHGSNEKKNYRSTVKNAFFKICTKTKIFFKFLHI